jgi:Methyltransferase domain
MDYELNRAAVAERATILLSSYKEAIAGIEPEAGFGGIWESEMFLFYAAVAPFAPGHILESGRARGKSTLILARCFPGARIISVEFDRQSENAGAAETKLKGASNVELLYGDSYQILPTRIQNGDAVLIDGPKGFRAIELAFALFQQANPCAVFIHDFPPAAPWRRFIERNWPRAFFGDDPLFEPFRVLDEGRDPRQSARTSPHHGYGIFACLPANSAESISQIRRKLFWAKFRSVFSKRAADAVQSH